MNLFAAAFDRSTALSDWLHEVLHEQGVVDQGPRAAVALALVSLGLDHREAFLLLVNAGARATAMAVTRPILEAYIRALWAFDLATEEQLHSFLTGRYDPSVETTLQRLRKALHAGGEVFEVLRKHYSLLNDYAHGGGRQVSRWLHVRGIEPSYSDEQMAEATHFVDVVGVLTALARERVLGHSGDALGAKLNELLTQGPVRASAARRDRHGQVHAMDA